MTVSALGLVFVLLVVAVLAVIWGGIAVRYFDMWP
jgi:hypothetical protein